MITPTREHAPASGRDHRNPRPASIGTGGIASTDSKKSDEIARKFLLAEKKAGHQFTDEPISIDGVRVTYLNPFDQFPPAQSPWLHKQRDWTWALIALCIGFAAYTLMRAIGWVIDGFAGSPPRV